ncbi:MAG: N-acetylmuramoyl-L-alanine amidase [Candidatus Nanopelagicales bacterium]
MAEMPITKLAVASKIYTGTQAPTLIVFHDVEAPCTPGRAKAVADYFAGSSGTPGGVAHYTVDPTATTHSVPENRACAHAGSAGNKKSVGIEMCGYASDSWTSANHTATWKRAADLARDIASRWGIPLTYLNAAALKAGKRSGYTFHRDVTAGLGGTTHTDPGNNFPYTAFHAYITRSGSSTTTTPSTDLPTLVSGVDGKDAGRRLGAWLHANYTDQTKPLGKLCAKIDPSTTWVGADKWAAMQQFARNVGLLTATGTLSAWGPRCWTAAQKEGFN